jgi:hypothetical protein
VTREIRFGVVSETVLDGPACAGLAFDSPSRRIDRLEESLAIISGLLVGRPVHHSGIWYQIDGLDLDVPPHDLQARRERFGLSYLVTPDHELPTLTAILAGS